MNKITSLAHSGDSSKIKKELMRLKSGTLFLVVVVFSVMGVILGYYLFGSGLTGTFNNVVYAYSGDEFMKVAVDTKEPMRTYIEYGTSTEILNRKNISRTFETHHYVDLNGLLPGKKHVFRIVAEDNTGVLYKSGFYFVE